MGKHGRKPRRNLSRAKTNQGYPPQQTDFGQVLDRKSNAADVLGIHSDRASANSSLWKRFFEPLALPLALYAIGVSVMFAQQYRGALFFYFVAIAYAAAQILSERWHKDAHRRHLNSLLVIPAAAILFMLSLWWTDITRSQAVAATRERAFSLSDPVVHVEPEHQLLWSSQPGQTLGVFYVKLSNTGPAIDHIHIDETFFVAEESSTDMVLQSIGMPRTFDTSELKTSGSFPFIVDFRSSSRIAKEVMIGFNGPSLFGVRIFVSFRRKADGKTFTYSKGLAALNPTAPCLYDSDEVLDREARPDTSKYPGMLIVSDGYNWQTNALNADEFPPGSSLTLP